MSTEHILEITLTLRGPVLVKSTSSSTFGLDAAMARVAYGPEADKPIVPGTLIKGKLAEALAQLAHLDASLETFCAQWLGLTTDGHPGETNGNSAGACDPFRGRLLFGDFVAQNAEEKNLAETERAYRGPDTRHRISIDDYLGSVKSGHLQVIEMPYAPWREVDFKGAIRFLADTATALKVERALRVGLSWLTQVGADRTTGFGRLLKVAVVKTAGRSATPIPLESKAPIALDLVIRPLGPLCVSKHKIGGNLYESEDVIPGNVLKGAVAETWAALAGSRLGKSGVAGLPDRKKLAEYFERIVFRHAFPTAGDARPQAVPLSVVKADCTRGKYWDVATCDGPAVFPCKDGITAPSFRTDWKGEDFDHIEPLFGWAQPPRELRVRTAIDSIMRRADKGGPGETPEPEGKLFAWEMVHPWIWDESAEKRAKPLAWRAHIDLSAVPEIDRADVVKQLTGILAALTFVSKTKSACEVNVKPAIPISPPPLAGTVILLLQTPALLADPRFPEDSKPPAYGAVSAERMKEVYQAAWGGLSENSLNMRRHFAMQTLVGGEYLYRQFQKKNGRPYTPWLLTSEGSVFVFDVLKNKEAEKKIAEWTNLGLPLTSELRAAFGDHWQCNPYLRENGFGEIAVHKAHEATPDPGDLAISVEKRRLPNEGKK
jgi:hypothetical protein